MTTIAIILARGGSKGVPGKNRRPVAGRPCIEWTIDAALEAREGGAVSRVALSTDDAALLSIALERGIETVRRPAALASDTAAVDEAARHAAGALSDARRVDAVVLLYANVPVRPAGLIGRAVGLLRESRADSVQSYSPVGKHHPYWTAVVGCTGEVRPWQGDVLNSGIYRRQDLPPAHVPDGGVLVVTRAALFHEIPGVPAGPHAFLGGERRGIVNPEGAVVDIDTEVDVIVADAILRERCCAA